jgi:hypothetical protein
MVVPPSGTHILEGGDHGFNGGDGQDGRFRARFDGEVGAGNGNVSDQAREDFDLAMTDMSGESGNPRELECPLEEGMGWIGDGDFTLAFLRDQRGITLSEVCRFRGCRRSGHSRDGLRSITLLVAVVGSWECTLVAFRGIRSTGVRQGL